VDNARTLEGIITAIEHIAENIKLVFPVHPRTQKNLDAFGLSSRIMHNENIICTGPLGYLDFISVMSKSSIVLTDSGGLQEETTFLGIPCLTLRESTERPVTVTEGTNIIVGNQTEKIIRAYDMRIHQNTAINKNPPKYWDGATAERIADIILQEV
jgi:UDP-N-acetylglucosamine 2-epimerase (non-hydrolysing)